MTINDILLRTKIAALATEKARGDKANPRRMELMEMEIKELKNRMERKKPNEL